MSIVNPPIQHDLLNNTQLFQFGCVHQIDQYGAIVGGVRVDGNGQVVTQAGTATIAQRTITGGSLTIDSVSAGKPLSATDYLCQSVQIVSIRASWADNTGRIGIGDATTWYSAINPMGVQILDAPTGGVLNLNSVIIYGSVIGDQVKFLVFNSV